MGDGQKMSLRLQGSQSFQVYSLSFTEPWLGGKKPNSLSTWINHSQFGTGLLRSNPNYSGISITGAGVGFGRRKKFPDDFFHIVSKKDIKNIYNQMEDILNNYVAKLYKPYAKKFDESENGFEVFGCDFMITDLLEVKLLEINYKVGYDDIVNGKVVKMEHVTPKPKDLIERLILASSNEGDVVMDPFVGMGTTAIVAKKLNRNYIINDFDEQNIEITKKSLEF